MTYKEWNSYKKYLIKQTEENKISKEEVDTTIKTMEKVFPCFTCIHNDGTQNGYCWSCGD